MLKIAFLNLMPDKEVTEANFARAFSASEEPVEFVLTRMGSHVSRHCSEDHMQLYRTTEEVCRAHDEGTCLLDGWVWTGAPLDYVPFEEVDYWSEACRLMDWLRARRLPSLYVCWGAQAALHYFHGVGRHEVLPHKLSGVYPQQVTDEQHPLFEGVRWPLCIPHSRHTTMNDDEIDQLPAVRALARSSRSGISIMECCDGLEFYLAGHQEYALGTLDAEYRRDTGRGLNVQVPENYYYDDDPAKGIHDTWQLNGLRVYANWVKHYCMHAGH